MGKNSGFDSTNRQVQDTIDNSTRRTSEFDNMLKGRLGGFDQKGMDMTNDAYGKLGDTYGQYGNMYGKYGDVANSGLADEYKARGFYQNWMKTGGFDPKQKQEFRARSLAPTTGFWDAYKQRMEQANATNPYNVGAGAQSAKGARTAAQDVNAAALGAETNLNDMIRQGQLAGASGETGIAGQINQNKLAGLSGQMGATAGQGQMAGAIGDLGTKQLDFATKTIDQMLSNAQLDANTKAQLLQLKAQMNPKVSGFDRAMQIAKMVAGAAAMFVPGGQIGGASMIASGAREAAGPPSSQIVSTSRA